MLRTWYRSVPVTLMILVLMAGLAGCSTPGRVHRSAARMHHHFRSCMEAYDQNVRYCTDHYDPAKTSGSQCLAGAEAAREECVKRAR